MEHRDVGGASIAMSVWIRFGAFVVLLAAGVVVVLLLPPFTVAEVRQVVADMGVAAPLWFIVAYAVATLMLLPKNVASIGAGVIFGFGWGLLYVWTAAVIGAYAAFWVGRWLGRDGIVRLVGSHLERLDAMVDKHGALAILILRQIPVVPFTAINYGAPLTAIRWRDYAWATAVGIIPGTAANVALGAYGHDLTSWQFILALAVTLGVIGGAWWWNHRRRRRTHEEAAVNESDGESDA
jgi:uncharacterized membrane protein YdjX (TVP38/TMEM64 family)